MAITTALLRRAETAILEVGSDEPVPLNEGEGMFPLTFSRASLRRVKTRQFWVDVWWATARFARGIRDTMDGFWVTVKEVALEFWRETTWTRLLGIA